jgi:hypothetical protein
MQDRNGADSAYLVPGTGYLASGTRSVFILHHAYPMGAFFEDKCQVYQVSGTASPGTWYPAPESVRTPMRAVLLHRKSDQPLGKIVRQSRGVKPVRAWYRAVDRTE